MGVDQGPDSVKKLMEAGYVKTIPNGFIFTREGLGWLITQVEELYHLYNGLHIDSSDNSSDQSGASSIQPE